MILLKNTSCRKVLIINNMPIIDYFSRNQETRAKFIFNSIAPLYSKFDKSLQCGFELSSKILDKEIIVAGKSILDIGTGSGAWAATLNKYGAAKVHGIDFSDRMIKRAQKNHPYMEFSLCHADNLSMFEDNSFDIVTASFVLHGPTKEKRQTIIKEMKRVSKKYVILHDMIGKTPIFVKFLEFLEQSDYKNFKKHFLEELKEEFEYSKKIPVKYGSGLYIAQNLN
jgi:ubiquinone/menaquinone biosynthesis C-methylase UbiE